MTHKLKPDSGASALICGRDARTTKTRPATVTCAFLFGHRLIMGVAIADETSALKRSTGEAVG